MARPTARVLALLEILQAGGTRTVGELAGRLEVDERTVRRYVEHLRDLEVPVRTVRGRHGGYRLAPGFRLPPLMFTDDEALAVLLGLGRWEGPAAESATEKLRRVLPEALGRRLDALRETVAVTRAPRAAETPEAGTLLLLAEAARTRRPVAISYTGREGNATERVIFPYGIVAHSGRWYVTGEDSLRGEVRTFRLDRITHPALRSGTFTVPEDADPAAQVLTGLASAPRRYAVSVLVEGPAEGLRLPTGLATVEELGERVRVRLRVESLDWVPGVLAGLDRAFVVEEPAELREHVRALARRLDRAADADAPAG